MIVEGPKEQTVATSLNVGTVSDLLQDALNELKGVVPPDDHNWHKTRIEWSENGYQISHSNRSDLPLIIELAKDRGQLPAVGRLAKSIETDHRYRRITDSVKGPPFFHLLPEQLALRTITAYVAELDSLQNVVPIAERVSASFVRSLEEGKADVVYYTVVRGLTCDFGGDVLSSEILLRRLSEADITEFIDRSSLSRGERQPSIEPLLA